MLRDGVLAVIKREEMNKTDFPLLVNNPWLIYFDNASTTQKPHHVIDTMSRFLENDYANIHRWMYDLSERSEIAYHDSKQRVASFLWAKTSEIIYSYNATYASNLIIQSLVNSGVISQWDTVLLGIWDHHATITPWQSLADQYWFSVAFIRMNDEYDIDREDFALKYDGSVKAVCCSAISNVTGTIIDMKKLWWLLRDETFFMIDWSQAVPHIDCDVEDLQCDCLLFTAHKLFASTWLWVIYLKKQRIRDLEPILTGWWTISDVTESGHALVRTAEKFEAGTPNIVGAVSLWAALEYIESVGWITAIHVHEQQLVYYMCEKFATYVDDGVVRVLWTLDPTKRIGVFSFIVEWMQAADVNEHFSSHAIAIRSWWHCAHPLMHSLGVAWSCRISLSLYNTKDECERFFDVLDELL